MHPDINLLPDWLFSLLALAVLGGVLLRRRVPLLQEAWVRTIMVMAAIVLFGSVAYSEYAHPPHRWFSLFFIVTGIDIAVRLGSRVRN